MTTNYLTDADITAVLGPNVLSGLFTPEGGVYDAASVVIVQEMASELARAALENAGYAPGDSSTNRGVINVAIAAFIGMAYGRVGLEIPPALETRFGGLLEGTRTGEVPVPGLSASKEDGVGGVRFSPTTGAGAKPQVMGNLRNIY